MRRAVCLHASTLCLAALTAAAAADPVAPSAPLALEPLPHAHFAFDGFVGARLHANLAGWLLSAPQANPGMLEMFRLRDRQPPPNLVPWAGEFVGKYLISAVQALRLTDDPRLRVQVSNVVASLIATQADDGYLGPFPKSERLLKHWDLWGHYHAIGGLLEWHERTGDATALGAARRAADLIAATYLDTGRRVLEAGDPEMNMAVIHGLGRLYRLTGEPRYLRLMREIETDWERAGDYLRAGLDGREFFQSPKPRWESLHDLQGLLELWQITGQARYREAFVHHWRSLRRWDRRNTGGFSSGEQATGNPYAPTPIETCCTVAWMALTLDYLRLTGDPHAADELELATFNAGLGAQHPCGRWWTYNTPMDGTREASAHTIVFQARAGTPELNCCSVNGPRVLGCLGDWAVMRSAEGVTVNWLGPCTVDTTLPDTTALAMRIASHYPVEGRVTITLAPAAPREFTLRVRMPAWARAARASLNGTDLPTPKAGSYLTLRRRWTSGDALTLDLPIDELRVVPGAFEATGLVSLYRGPILLAYDQSENPFDADAIPPVRPAGRRAALPPPAARDVLAHQPQLIVELEAEEGRTVRLVDFASAGAAGTRYRSWLPTTVPLPPPAFTQQPADGAHVAPGAVPFRWRAPRAPATAGTDELSFTLQLATNAAFAPIAFESSGLRSNRITLAAAQLAALGRAPLYWRVNVRQGDRETQADVPPAWFQIDPDRPPAPPPATPALGPNGELLEASLRAGFPDGFGEWIARHGAGFTTEGATLRGDRAMLVFAVPEWPEDGFTLFVRVRVDAWPTGRLGQVFSAWTAGMDDPLRVTVESQKLHARIEAGAGYGTAGVPIEDGRWYGIAAVRDGATLRLYLDGREVAQCAAPPFVSTASQRCALGGNPKYDGNESLEATFADFALFPRAFRADEVASWNVR